MRSYLDRGYTVVKMKIGCAPTMMICAGSIWLSGIGSEAQLAVDANGRFDLETAVLYAERLWQYDLFYSSVKTHAV
jgi:D(-)-tartrate dehydratase